MRPHSLSPLEEPGPFQVFSLKDQYTKEIFRGASHYGRPNREAVEVSGQTLLRVQRNGLKIGN